MSSANDPNETLAHDVYLGFPTARLPKEMKSIFIVQHLHTLPHGEEDVKVIGAYKSLDAAKAAVDRVKVQQGFRDNPRVVNPEIDDDPQGFYIDEYYLDKDNWEEGFITQ